VVADVKPFLDRAPLFSLRHAARVLLFSHPLRKEEYLFARRRPWSLFSSGRTPSSFSTETLSFFLRPIVRKRRVVLSPLPSREPLHPIPFSWITLIRALLKRPPLSRSLFFEGGVFDLNLPAVLGKFPPFSMEDRLPLCPALTPPLFPDVVLRPSFKSVSVHPHNTNEGSGRDFSLPPLRFSFPA